MDDCSGTCETCGTKLALEPLPPDFRVNRTIPHESPADCIRALAARVEELESALFNAGML